MQERTGPELLAEVIANPLVTLNTVLDRDPEAMPLSDDELRELVMSQRRDRAAIELKLEKAKLKKEGVETDDETDSPATE
jgi:hypothetical protein